MRARGRFMKPVRQNRGWCARSDCHQLQARRRWRGPSTCVAPAIGDSHRVSHLMRLQRCDEPAGHVASARSPLQRGNSHQWQALPRRARLPRVTVIGGRPSQAPGLRVKPLTVPGVPPAGEPCGGANSPSRPRPVGHALRPAVIGPTDKFARASSNPCISVCLRASLN